MKVLTLSVYIMNVMEQITGLNLLSDLDVRVTGRKLVSGDTVPASPTFADIVKENTMAVKLASLNDPFVIDDPRNDVLIGAPEGIIFIGDSDKVVALSEYMGCGKMGFAGECVHVDGFPRAFWSTEDVRLYCKVYDFVKNGAPAPDDGCDGPADDEDKSAEKPAPEPARPPKKGSTKSTKKGSKPAAKPTKPKTVDRKPPEEAGPVEEAESAEESATESVEPQPEAEKPRRKPTLEELFLTGGADIDPEDAVEETAVQTCRRLCREAGIECNIADEE